MRQHGDQGRMRGDPFERMFSVVKELLWRQRQIEFFPITPMMDVLASLLPPEMQDWDKPTDNIYWQNLSHCISADVSIVVELEGITGRAFWMHFGTKIPAPLNAQAFTMPPDNPYFGQIDRWHKRAMVIHEELKMYETALWDFLQRAHHPELVEKYWLELHPFVNFEPHAGHSMKAPDLLKRRLIPLPSEKDRAGIIETLAASTLLPVIPCDAWVDYEVGR